IGCAQKPVLKRVQIERIAFGSNIAESARHQARTDVTDTGSNLQNVVAKMRPDGVRQPTHVLRCACQVVEESAAVLTDIKVVDQPKAQNYTQRFDTIPPADFLSLFISPPVVTDRNLVDPQFALGAL